MFFVNLKYDCIDCNFNILSHAHTSPHRLISMQQVEQILSEKPLSSASQAYFAHAAACSPFFARLLTKYPTLVTDLSEDIDQRYQSEDVFALFKHVKNLSETEFLQQIRMIRQRLMARLIVRDLNQLADFYEVVELTSALAEAAITEATAYYDQQLQAEFGVPLSDGGEPQQLIVVGMGKLGGRELNVSSDVDLIFAYEHAGQTNGPRSISLQDYFTRLGKKLIAALDEVTADGFVFRVDMRLRPFGSEGALVCNLDALEDYYQHYGREWERYAWIKGRVITGPSAALTQLIKPFIFRRYLDFNAYAAMRDLKTQIQRDVAQRQLSQNIKLGRGGIREVEFIAQLFQLIRGGQIPALQIKPTLSVLEALAARDMLPALDVEHLQQSYIYLRNVEHRLMYIDDQQTQDLPTSPLYQQCLLNMMGLSDWTTFLVALSTHQDRVQAFFDDTFKEEQRQDLVEENAIWQGTISKEAGCAWLAAHGYQTAQATWHLLQRSRNSQKIQQLPEPSRRRFDQLMPLLMREATLQHSTLPDTALLRTMDVLERVCRRASYLALLTEFPDALNLVVKLCSASPWMAQYVAAHPILLDELLNKHTLFQRLNAAQLKEELSRVMQQLQGDVEAQMDAIRHFKHGNILKIAAQDLMAALPLESVSDDLSALAEVILQVSVDTVWQNLAIKHRPQPQFAVIAYGKLGGRELGYLSDLDLIFLYDDDATNAQDVYARFAQRLSAWFNTLTNAGLLYETDLQLRPDGNSGLLVSSVHAFADYQLHKAWVWEHQALTRARFVAGHADIGAFFERLRLDVIRMPRDAYALCVEIKQMREKMRQAQTIKSGLFDLKRSAGGIIDVEFMVQYMVLRYAPDYPVLAENMGNIALLAHIEQLQLLADVTDLGLVANAYKAYRTLIHQAKLQEKETALPMHEVEEVRATVIALWARMFDCTRED